MIKNILAVVILLVAGRSIGADLFSSTTVLEASRLNITEQDGLMADVNVALLKSKQVSFQIQLPSGKQVTAEFEKLQENHQTGYSWQGRVNHDTSQIINISVYEDAIAGSIHTDNAVYEIQPMGNHQVRIVELNTAAFPECSGGEVVVQPVINIETAETMSHRGMETVDVIVVYTPQARQGAGGHNQIKATAQAAVDAMNSSLINSQVNTEVVLLYAGEVKYNDSESSSTDLTWIKNSSEVKGLLDLYGADMAGLLVNSLGGNSCGRGYVMRNPGSSFRDYAVQVTARSCAVGNLSFAHEFGHNMGLEHDPVNGTSPVSASYPWSFGHYHSGLYRTVMSYSSECTGGCARRQYFSNPNVSYLSLPTGVDSERDNARTLGLTSSVTAAFRDRMNDVIFADGFDF